MKHTKGPWKIKKHPTDETILEVLAPYGKPICQIGSTSTQDNADFRLIAAAPELLEHIKGFVKLIETAEEMNNVATDSNQNPQKKGMTWADYRKLTQSLRNDAKLLVAKAEGLTDKETADEAALRG